ncbi:hypothetical protein SteCoe_9071 [Stentor coeruleus]|uniref:Importin subunit alpha n=1 Tax=Stentor coeruleus TaxID=5963 RepID=A0A1R2CIT8_9CILI|nr:hypothetical protein SteCoe_9071 [Stentor coeruleus]
MEKITERKDQFQKINYEKVSQSREKFAVELRKSKRKEFIQGRRKKSDLINCLLQKDTLMNSILCEPEEDEGNLIEIEDIQLLIQSLKGDSLDQISAINTIKDLVSNNNMIAEKFVEHRIIDVILPLIQQRTISELKSLGYLIICNIASSTKLCVNKLLEADIITIIFKELNSNQYEIFDTLFWTISNLLGDNDNTVFIEITDMNFFEITFNCINQYKSNKFLDVVAWTLINAVHYENLITKTHLDTILKIALILLETDDLEVKYKTIQFIMLLIRKDNEKIDFISHSIFLNKCFELWDIRELSIMILRLCANISCGNNSHLQILLDLNILDYLEKSLIGNQNSYEITQVFFCLSNIAAGNTSQVKAISNHSMFFISLNGILCEDEKVQEEATYYLRNFTMLCERKTLKKMFSMHFLKGITDGFQYAKTNNSIMNLLISYDMVAKVVDKTDLFAENCHWILEDLIKHKNPEIYSKSSEILEKYYGITENLENTYVVMV